MQVCTKRNIHGRSQAEIERCVEGWEPTPNHHPVLDASALLKDTIQEVEMEVVDQTGVEEEEEEEEEQKNPEVRFI